MARHWLVQASKDYRSPCHAADYWH